MGAATGAQAGIGGLQLLDAKNKSDAIKRQSAFEADQIEFNAKLIGFQKTEVEDKAVRDKLNREKLTRQILGTQKVGFAGQGIDLDSEVARKLRTEAREVGQEDVAAIQNNAWREIMGLELQEQDLKSQAAFTRIGGRSAANQTLATGGLQALSTGVSAYNSYRYRRELKRS